MQSITLIDLLPRVFDGEQHQSPVKDSGVWCRQSLTLTRPGRYLLFAESGTGKSSLCSFIYGSRRDYLGRIEFDHTDASSLTLDQWARVRTQSLAYLPQEMRLFPQLSAIDNILIKNRLTDYRSESEIRAMMQRLEVDHRADFAAGHLSVGQQQRVAIIRALCQPFDFILLDEPVSHLDGRTSQLVADLITEAADTLDAGIIATSVGHHLPLSNPKELRL